MADYRTEEEQIELLKRWWQENGKSTVAGVVVALAGYAGWMGWTSHQQTVMADAADIYQQMVVATEAGDAAKESAMAEQLRQAHAASVYGVFATLHLAKAAVEAGDLAQAATLLDSLQGQKLDASLAPLVSFRFAQIRYAQGDYDKALALLEQVKGGNAWLAAAAELRGDIQLAQGKTDDARTSYEVALKALDTSGAQDRRADLEMKLADVARPASAVPAVGDRS